MSQSLSIQCDKQTILPLPLGPTRLNQASTDYIGLLPTSNKIILYDFPEDTLKSDKNESSGQASGSPPKNKFAFKIGGTKSKQKDKEKAQSFAMIYDIQKSCWENQKLQGKQPTSRKNSLFCLIGHLLLVFGGENTVTKKLMNDIHCLNTQTWTWKKLFCMEGPSSNNAFNTQTRHLVKVSKTKVALISQTQVWTFQTEGIKWQLKANQLPGGIWVNCGINLKNYMPQLENQKQQDDYQQLIGVITNNGNSQYFQDSSSEKDSSSCIMLVVTLSCYSSSYLLNFYRLDIQMKNPPFLQKSCGINANCDFIKMIGTKNQLVNLSYNENKEKHDDDSNDDHINHTTISTLFTLLQSKENNRYQDKRQFLVLKLIFQQPSEQNDQNSSLLLSASVQSITINQNKAITQKQKDQQSQTQNVALCADIRQRQLYCLINSSKKKFYKIAYQVIKAAKQQAPRVQSTNFKNNNKKQQQPRTPSPSRNPNSNLASKKRPPQLLQSSIANSAIHSIAEESNESSLVLNKNNNNEISSSVAADFENDDYSDNNDYHGNMSNNSQIVTMMNDMQVDPSQSFKDSSVGLGQGAGEDIGGFNSPHSIESDQSDQQQQQDQQQYRYRNCIRTTNSKVQRDERLESDGDQDNSKASSHSSSSSNNNPNKQQLNQEVSSRVKTTGLKLIGNEFSNKGGNIINKNNVDNARDRDRNKHQQQQKLLQYQQQASQLSQQQQFSPSAISHTAAESYRYNDSRPSRNPNQINSPTTVTTQTAQQKRIKQKLRGVLSQQHQRRVTLQRQAEELEKAIRKSEHLSKLLTHFSRLEDKHRHISKVRLLKEDLEQIWSKELFYRSQIQITVRDRDKEEVKEQVDRSMSRGRGRDHSRELYQGWGESKDKVQLQHKTRNKGKLKQQQTSSFDKKQQQPQPIPLDSSQNSHNNQQNVHHYHNQQRYYRYQQHPSNQQRY